MAAYVKQVNQSNRCLLRDSDSPGSRRAKREPTWLDTEGLIIISDLIIYSYYICDRLQTRGTEFS